MKYLKALFGEEALTYDQFVAKLAEAGDGIKLANLAEGGYVSRAKYDDDVADAKGKLDAANGTITDLQGKLSQFDGVDVDDLNGRLQTLQQQKALNKMLSAFLKMLASTYLSGPLPAKYCQRK